MHRILVVDDESSISELLKIYLTKQGYVVDCASSGRSALDHLQNEIYAVVLTDLCMPEMNGIQMLEKAHSLCPDTVILMMTAYATAETAVEAMKAGAYDYLMKPFKLEEVQLIVKRAAEQFDINTFSNRRTSGSKNNVKVGTSRLIGQSTAITKLRDIVQRVANARTSVIIIGESGTGKELVARAIHEESGRSQAPFVAVNCGAIPADMMESELFGYLKGAFTGADTNRMGLFEAAHGGTLFLDEIGEMPVSLQVKLLRVLQEKCIRRLGSQTDTPVDVRILSATNRDLSQSIEMGTFRQDLFFRLNVVQIDMPPLRERKDDIPMLIDHFLQKYALEQEKPVMNLSNEVKEKIAAYDFPGNIRELENIIEQSVALSLTQEINVEVLPHKMMLGGGETRSSTAPDCLENQALLGGLDQAMDQLERQMLVEALKQSGGIRKKAAELLKISFRSMRYRLNKHQISLQDDTSSLP